MNRMFKFVMAAVLAFTMAGVAMAAKKPAPVAVPAGFAAVASVDEVKKSFTLDGDATIYKYDDKTVNAEKITVGSKIKVTSAPNDKALAASIEVPPTPTPKKKKK